MDDFEKRPNRIPWPPLIYACALAGGVLLDWGFPIEFLAITMNRTFMSVGGVLLAGLGLALDVAAMVMMYRARTNILPHRAADKLLTSGVFALTRNPIYLGNTLLLAGFALFTAAVWLILATMIAAFAVDRLAIRREELHLAVRFGDAFQAYVQTTPRWLSVPWKIAAAK